MAKECDRLINPKEAIEMVQRCRKDRLPYVLDILRVAGYEFTEREMQFSRASKVSYEQISAANRKAKEKDWVMTDDEVVILLRDAYLKGVKFTDINRLTGINRTVLYEYLKGKRSIPLAYRDKLNNTLRELMERGKMIDG